VARRGPHGRCHGQRDRARPGSAAETARRSSGTSATGSDGDGLAPDRAARSRRSVRSTCSFGGPKVNAVRIATVWAWSEEWPPRRGRRRAEILGSTARGSHALENQTKREATNPSSLRLPRLCG
jgi:hypothetical protein